MMHLIVVFVLLLLCVASPPFGIVATLVYLTFIFLLALSKTDRRKSSTQRISSNSDQQQIRSDNLADLTILRLEIDRLRQDGVLNPNEAEAYRKQIDSVVAQYLSDCSVRPDNVLWKQRREQAWTLLKNYQDTELGPPPWLSPVIAETETETVETESLPENRLQADEELLEQVAAERALGKEFQKFEPKPLIHTGETPLKPEEGESEASKPRYETRLQAPIEQLEREDKQAGLVSECQAEQGHLSQIEGTPSTAEDGDSEQETSPRLKARLLHQSNENETAVAQGHQQDLQDYAWQPRESGVLEKTLATLSGWHAMAAPFLLQNIGWFVGVFCFIAGSVFLVSYSTGYSKNLIAFITLFIFTLFLLWGGYQIRSKRPELKTSSHVIFILSMLLIPLVTTAGINLLINSEKNALMILSGFLLIVELTAFYYAVMMVATLMDRSLQQRFPRFFLALNCSQLLLIPLAVLPYWPVVMLAHLFVFALLNFGIHAFIKEWLRAIFLDRRKISYFAAGTLIYAAMIAFINFTWGTDKEIVLPAGYTGFFLIVLCALLFYMDTQFKQWVDNQAYLSRFSFVVYALSILALFIEMPQQSMAIPTLCLAIVLYAFVVWNYLTLIPLYLFLLCSFWLYGLLILQHYAPNLHFILAFPGLYALYWAAKWSLTIKRSEHLAVIVYRMLHALLALLAAWSLFNSQQGWLGLINALLVCQLLYLALKSAPIWLFLPRAKINEPLVVNSSQNLLLTPWYYGISLLWVVAVFYLPMLPGLQTGAQLGLALSLLAVYWMHSGLKLFNNGNRASTVAAIEMRLNSAILCLLFMLTFAPTMQILSQWLCLAFVGAVVLWLSLRLRVQWLLYLTMLAWGLSGMLIKAAYFPAPSTGLVEMLVALSIWVLLWWLERDDSSEVAALQRQAEVTRAGLLPTFRLLWLWPVNAVQETAPHD